MADVRQLSVIKHDNYSVSRCNSAVMSPLRVHFNCCTCSPHSTNLIEHNRDVHYQVFTNATNVQHTFMKLYNCTEYIEWSECWYYLYNLCKLLKYYGTE